MGGSLYGAERMPRDKFLKLLASFVPELKSILGSIEFMPVPYYSEKEDFGDLDVIVKANTDVVRAAVVKHFGFVPENLPENSLVSNDALNELRRHQYTTNDNVFSFVYEKFQIDLICTVNDYDMSLAYYSYNDVGNILGRFFHKFGLKFGHQGLIYPLRDDRGQIRKEIVVCKDTSKIIRFLGLDASKWMNGFSTLEDIFEWVAAGKYFDPNIFLGELSAINEKRDRKRKTFSKFLDWLESSNPEQRYEFLKRDDRDRYVPQIERYFGVDLNGEMEKFNKQMEREDMIRSKFNGEIVMEITGLKGKELGSFMNKFRENDYDKSFDDYILETSQESIRQYIKVVFDLQKN